MFWNAKNGSVELDGTELSYVSFGYGEKPFVLLPGLSDGLTTVQGKALLLAKPYSPFFERCTVYLFSRKNRMPNGHSIRDMAVDQAEAMRLLGIKRAFVMGVSQGGMIAQHLASDHADLVEKLVLAVTCPYANETVRACVESWIALAKDRQYRRLLADMNEKSYSDAYIKKYERFYGLLGAWMKRLQYDRFFVNAEAILRFDARDALDRINCPTFVLGGAKDRIVGAEAAEELNLAIANSKCYVYEEFGHAAFEEAKDFNKRVFDFLLESDEHLSISKKSV